MDQYNLNFERLREIVTLLDSLQGNMLPGSPGLNDCLLNHYRMEKLKTNAESRKLINEGLKLWEEISKFQYDNFEKLR